MNPQQPYQQQPYRPAPAPTQQAPGYGHRGNYGMPPQPVVPRGDRNGLGTAGLVLGILAVLFSWIPLLGIIAWPLGILGAVLALVGMSRVSRGEATSRGVAIGGLVTSLVALAICFLWVIGIGVAGTTVPSKPSVPTAAAVPAIKTNTQANQAAQPVAPAKPAGPAAEVGDGTYQVGVDMAAGRYKTPGPTDSFIHNCYWQRSQNDSGEFSAIISNGNAQGPGSVTVKQGEFFETSGGCTWTKQ